MMSEPRNVSKFGYVPAGRLRPPKTFMPMIANTSQKRHVRMPIAVKDVTVSSSTYAPVGVGG
jgi:hypothetical protein